MENVDLPKFGALLDGNTTLVEKSPAHRAAYLCCIILFIVNLVLSIITFTFALTSWIVLPRWRRFLNYVCMNLMVVSDFNMIGFHLCAHNKYPKILIVFLTLVPRIIMSHWLLVATATFYLDIVNVYSTEISRKYLKANMFSWLLPFIEVLTVYPIDNFFGTNLVVYLNYAINVLILLIACILYFRVVLSIVKLMLAKQETWRDIFSKIFVAVGLSIPSGLSSFIPVMVIEVMHVDMVKYNVGLILCLLNITAGNIAFLCLRRHRVLWGEYWRRRRAINDVYKVASSPINTTSTPVGVLFLK